MDKIQKFCLTHNSNLSDCEKILKTVATATAPVRLELSSVDRKIFLKDLRVASIISASSKKAEIECEWRDDVSGENRNSLAGLASIVYGILPAKGLNSISVAEVKRDLASRSDVLEDPPGVGETLTICAIDTTNKARPLVFPDPFDKYGFIAEFGNFVNDFFDRGPSDKFMTMMMPNLLIDGLDGPSQAELIFGFVFELYQNTFIHGCLDENQKIIPGLRVIRLRKRVGHGSNRNNFVRWASGFEELETYFHETVPKKKTFKFYEISISDNGLGILRRFCSAPQHRINMTANQDGNLELLNSIVEQSLSSDGAKSGMGEGGLKNALMAVDNLKGFVSLRCDNIWACRGPLGSSKNSAKGNWFQQVKYADDLAIIPGTHFSLILPAS